ncbi:MAG: DNA-formamidopyrimidine glycosylase family protein [Acidimicrobiales bacterium]
MVKLELPEIETLRRDLERDVVGRKIKSAEAVVLKSMPRHKTRKSFEDPLAGAKVTGSARVALDLVLQLDNEHALVISLGENGRLARTASKDKQADDTVANITFTQGGDLRILDHDGTSAIHVVTDAELAEVLPEPAQIGLDLHEHPVSWIEFGQMVMSRRMPLKLLLTDGSIFVGIGDIYSNEILFDSGLRHDRWCNELSTQEIRRLYRSVVGILHDAIKYGGTSLPDRPFADLSGKAGEYADHLSVYGRAGDLSPRSRVPIQKTSFKHQVVFFCNTQV